MMESQNNGRETNANLVEHDFIDLESNVEHAGDKSSSSLGQSPSHALLGGRHQYFGGLAVAPITAISCGCLSTEDVMKLRSIMRFSIEYHNPLVIYSDHLPPSNPIKQFTETASACFDVIYKIILAISAHSLDSGEVIVLCNYFRRLESKLAELEDEAKQQVEGTTLLKQSAGAVQGQMKDFISLMEASILPNLAS
jgi:hypothetical protein